jgi:hypothetical protein
MWTITKDNDSKQAHAKLLTTITPQGNANQSHEIPLHTYLLA